MQEPTPAEIRLFRRLSQLALDFEAGRLTRKQAEILIKFLHSMRQVVDEAAESKTIDERQEIFLRAETSMTQYPELARSNIFEICESEIFVMSRNGKRLK